VKHAVKCTTAVEMARACAAMRIEGKKSEAPYLGLPAFARRGEGQAKPLVRFPVVPGRKPKRADASTMNWLGQRDAEKIQGGQVILG